MASLSELLAKDGFETCRKTTHRKLSSTVAADHDAIVLPIYICHDRKTSHVPRHKHRIPRTGSSKSGSSISEPAIDEAATKAVVSILSGYVGHYVRDRDSRDSLRGKCSSCFVRMEAGSSSVDEGVFADMELGIESIERLIEEPGTETELRMRFLRNSIGFLTIVASLNSRGSANGRKMTPDSHRLSACAQLYLAIVYKLEKNDRVCARHALQVFVDSPQWARTHLLPDLWDHFFLPHLLHLKIWYDKQVESLSGLPEDQQEQQLRYLREVYDDQMDMGTTQFALYYKEWLKTGAQSPANLPSVPLPLTASSSRHRRSSSQSLASHSSINDILYRTVFGSPQQSIVFDDGDGSIAMEQNDEELRSDDYKQNQHTHVKSRLAISQSSSSESCRNSHEPNYTRCLPCRTLETEPTKTDLTRAVVTPPSDLTRAVVTISNSHSLHECETAIRVMTAAWLASHKDCHPSVETTLSKPSVIEGVLEVLSVSENEEVLEMGISLLTELTTQDESNRGLILSLDPRLDGFLKLMRNGSLFLKAASLLHVVRPRAEHMGSAAEWVPLVLRVLEFGDHTQTLFGVRCAPHAAAYYFLDRLLGGFDEDRNGENARQVVSLGGLGLLLRRMEVGDVLEKCQAASVVNSCVRADGRSRHYLVENLNPEFVLGILVRGKDIEIALSLLVELVCIHRFAQRKNFFDKLLRGLGCLNTMQILLVSLQRATREQRPLIATILLQLDLMGDPLKSSVYRAEAIEAMIEALDCRIFDEKVQRHAADALLILGGRYSYTGASEVEKWILKEAGYDESLEGGFDGRRHVGTSKDDDEEVETEHWQRKTALVLWNGGSEKLMEVLGESMAHGIPCLARASLVTVAWMSKSVHTATAAAGVTWSALARRLIRWLDRDNAMEERVLASFSLLALSNNSGCLSEISNEEKNTMLVDLRNISKATWTAKKLTSMVEGGRTIRHSGP